MTTDKGVLTFALDYDNTFTIDPMFWWNFIETVGYFGYRVVLCTYRDERYDMNPEILQIQRRIPVYFTRGVAKAWWMEQFGCHVDIWIDDKPKSIFENSQTPVEGLAEWRKQNEENLRNRQPAKRTGESDSEYAARIFGIELRGI